MFRGNLLALHLFVPLTTGPVIMDRDPFGPSFQVLLYISDIFFPCVLFCWLTVPVLSACPPFPLSSSMPLCYTPSSMFIYVLYWVTQHITHDSRCGSSCWADRKNHFLWSVYNALLDADQIPSAFAGMCSTLCTSGSPDPFMQNFSPSGRTSAWVDACICSSPGVQLWFLDFMRF